MTDKKPSVAGVLKGFFGLREGTTLTGFVAELKELTDEDKAQLVAGITDGTLTY